jgi:hypothetical protein
MIDLALDFSSYISESGYCSTRKDSKDWLKPIFDQTLQDLVDRFSA